MKRLIFLTMAIMTCPLSLPAPAQQIFVDDSASGSNDGSNWTNAFNYLQDALEIAQNGDEIHVAQGTYRPDQGDEVSTGDPDAAFNMKTGVTIKGGYAGFGAPDPDARGILLWRTILSGDLLGNDVEITSARDLLGEPTRADNSHSIVSGGTYSEPEQTPVIEGFTIKGAFKSALNLNHSYIIVTNCIFQANAAEDSCGGAVYFDNSRAIFTRCSFLDNVGAEHGGAIYIDGCGTCPSMYAAFVDCIFMGNYAFSYGGAICSRSTTLTTAINCLFIANTANSYGAALYEDSYTYGNQLGSHLVNCTFAGNNCIAVYVTQYGFASLTSCILWDNLCGTNGGLVAQISCKMPGTGSGSANINYCCIQGWDGSLGGAGNFPDNPKFVSPGVWDPYREYTPGDDYRLRPDSPCINAGDPSFVAAPTNPSIPSIYYFPGEDMGPYILRSSEQDLDGDPRMFDGRVDMGPYERSDTSLPVLYVDDDATGANNGSSWANAYRYLQDALEAASNGFEIRVAQGTYKPDQGDEVSTADRGAIFTLSGVPIRGGYAGYGSPDPSARDIQRYKTILSGDLAGNDVEVADPCDLLTEPSRSENSENILTGGGVLDGFTVTSANCTYSGGGIVMGEADLVVTDCVFTANSAGYRGGAMTGFNSQVVFERCQFIGNAAAGDGGAVFMDTCTCRDGYLACVDCKFTNNSAGGDGGAICIQSMAVMLTSLMNCLIVGNSAEGRGSALYDRSENGSSWLVNCTLSGNWAKSEAPCGEYEDAPISLVNCILWYNQGKTICPATVSYRYTTSEYLTASGDPCFVSPGHWDADDLWVDGDYHLCPTSPCINAGDPEFISEPANPTIPGGTYIGDPEPYIIRSSDRDLDGWPRVALGRVDMGAYEHQVAALIAHWKLDETEGDIAQDSAGTNDGILNGDPQWLPNEGRVEGALAFDGDGDYVNCGNDAVFDITAQISVAAWVRINAVNMEWQTVIAKGDSAWRLSTAEDEYRYCFAVTGGPPWNYISGDTVVAANEWHHVCGTYDGEDLRLYIDGAEDPAGPVPEAGGVTTNEYDVLIGENQERPGRYWDGMIDDVRIYNYALSAAEVSQLFSPTIIYVDADARGANNGSCWADAFNCLQDALAIATEGAEIRVAQGTYRPDCGNGITPGDRTATFQLKNAVAIRGGYAGHGEPQPDTRDVSEYQTILSGDLAGNDAEIYDPEQLGWEPTRSENAYHVVTATQINETAVIDGFTITAGNADYYDFSLCNGPGMFNNQSSSTILNCTFIANFAGNNDGGGAGGAMFNLASHPAITNCKFVGNAAIALDGGEGSAGAVFNENSNPRIADCTFIGNVAGHDGGAMYNYYSSPTLANCEFIGNLAREGGSGSYGGAVSNYGSNPVFTNCLFAGNKARSSQIGSGGGAIWAGYGIVTIINCTFSGNAAEKGGAIYSYDHYEADFSLTNSILWNDTPDEIYTLTVVPIVKYCDVQGGQAGEGNITADSCFVAPGYWDDDDFWINGDYHLKSFGWRWDAAREQWTFDRVTSRCIDAGNPGSPLLDEPLTVPSDPDNDYGQNLRINMGAYGGTAEASMPPYDWAILADINNDGIVDFCDFAYVGMDWGLGEAQQPGDFDRNSGVGPTDLDLLADDWLRKTTWRE